MSIYSTLNWIALPFWILSCYPQAYLGHIHRKDYICASSTVFSFMQYFSFLLVTILQEFIFDFELKSYSDLVIGIHSTIFSAVFILYQLDRNYEFYQEISSFSQYLTVITWTGTIILFGLFASETIKQNQSLLFSIGANITIELSITLMILSKFSTQYWHMARNGFIYWSFFGSLLEITGSGLWVSSIILYSLDKNSLYVLDNIGKASMSIITIVFNLIAVFKKFKKIRSDKKKVLSSSDSYIIRQDEVYFRTLGTEYDLHASL
jgi:hypothetical protein